MEGKKGSGKRGHARKESVTSNGMLGKEESLGLGEVVAGNGECECTQRGRTGRGERGGRGDWRGGRGGNSEDDGGMVGIILVSIRKASGRGRGREGDKDIINAGGAAVRSVGEVSEVVGARSIGGNERVVTKKDSEGG